MKITESRDAQTCTLWLSGRLDTLTAPQLQEKTEKNMGGVTHLKIDMENLEYVSSAGLRVLLSTAKRMNAEGGSMVITGANEDIREVFRITGFDTILTVL